MKKKFLIIGGGMTGCATALYLANNGFDVTICEKNQSLGGIAKDINFSNETFLSGPHYLKSNSFLVSELKKEKFFDEILKGNNYLYGSFTNLFNESIYDKYFAHPVLNFNSEIKEVKKSYFSLEERLNCYPQEISQKLKDWTQIFENNIGSLHHNCAHPMGISRIYFKNKEERLKNLKKNNIYSDEILGIPNLDYLKGTFYLPKYGYNNFFTKLQSILEEKEVKINLNTKIKAEESNSRLDIVIDRKKMDFDFIVWAANPVPLIKLLGLGKIDNPVAKVNTVSANFTYHSTKYESQYYQIFSDKSNLLRLFVYNLHDKNKLSIDLSFNKNKIDINKELELVKKILKNFKIESNIDKKIYETKSIRHIFFSKNDFKKFEKFEKISKKLNLVGGGWHIIGSDNKIKYIQKKINEILAH